MKKHPYYARTDYKKKRQVVISKMRIKQVGKSTYEQGKRLFDILCRLKNFGVGRLVYRNHELERYPEFSYYVVKKVEPDMSDPTQVSDNVKLG